MSLDASSLKLAAIRPEDEYGGRRLTLRARLGNTRLRVQVDVGFGDAVTPAPEWLEYPSMLALPRPRLRAYSPETTIAEKVHTMVVLGTTNSRMRDFFDLYVLAMRRDFQGERLARALRATFERRRTALPSAIPLLLMPESAEVAEKAVQWGAFLRKSALSSAPGEFEAVVVALAGFLAPVIEAAREGRALKAGWAPVGRGALPRSRQHELRS